MQVVIIIIIIRGGKRVCNDQNYSARTRGVTTQKKSTKKNIQNNSTFRRAKSFAYNVQGKQLLNNEEIKGMEKDAT